MLPDSSLTFNIGEFLKFYKILRHKPGVDNDFHDING